MAEHGRNHEPIYFTFNQLSLQVAEGIVTIDESILGPVRQRIAQGYCTYYGLPGFEKAVPAEYAKAYFAKEIKTDTERFLLRHFVLDTLMAQLIANKIVYSNWPRLDDITLHDDNTLRYRFIISQAPAIALKEWKFFVFKQPKRKNYKDLDTQVATFLKKEASLFEAQELSNVEPGDWVHFELQLLDEKTEPILPANLAHGYWLRISKHQITSEIHQLFLGKAIHSSFVTSVSPFSTTTDQDAAPCFFGITIKAIVKGAHLSVDALKNTFKLKTRADVHRKLIEIFSFRNDISQRRAIIEEVFHLLFTKHRFEVPKHIITRKKELILNDLKMLPDYHVYKGHREFEAQIEMLAEKLLQEEIIIDNISIAENISITPQDVAGYLHLFNNERLKEFIYFRPLIDRIEETDTPIHYHLLAQSVLREKTLNHIINTLS